jgi:hypothetical protein
VIHYLIFVDVPLLVIPHSWRTRDMTGLLLNLILSLDRWSIVAHWIEPGNQCHWESSLNMISNKLMKYVCVIVENPMDLFHSDLLFWPHEHQAAWLLGKESQSPGKRPGSHLLLAAFPGRKEFAGVLAAKWTHSGGSWLARFHRHSPCLHQT